MAGFPSSADPESQLQAILQLTMEKTAATGAAIVISTNNVARCQASIGSAPDVGGRLQPGISLSALCLATSETLISDDTHTDRRLDSQLCKQADIRSILALPIKEAPGIVGVLELVSDKLNAFSQRNIAAMNELADAAAPLLASEPDEFVSQLRRKYRKYMEAQANAHRNIAAMNELADAAAPLLSELASEPDGFVSQLRRKYMEAQANAHDAKLQRSILLQRLILRMKILTGLSAILILALIVNRYARHYLGIEPHLTPPATVAKHEPVLSEQDAAPEQGSNTDRQFRAPENVVTASREEVISAIQEPVQDTDVNRTLNQANAGAVTAQYEMGLRYANGEGVPQNYQDAMTWFAKASDAGNAKAQWKLALGYLEGIGVPRDERQAIVWLKRAANNGDTRAQRALSEMYLSGREVPRDYVRAYTWANIAAELERNDKGQLQTIRSRMTPIQIADAERRTSIWRYDASRRAAKQPNSQRTAPPKVVDK
jgi:TPR repeat protein